MFSKKLSDIEERKRGYIARRVEASDKERVDAEPVDSGPATATGAGLESTEDTLTPGVSDVQPSTVESRMCTWIECSHDKRSWAEVQEEEQRERADGVLRRIQAPTP